MAVELSAVSGEYLRMSTGMDAPTFKKCNEDSML